MFFIVLICVHFDVIFSGCFPTDSACPTDPSASSCGRISSPFGPRYRGSGASDVHLGHDFPLSLKTPLYAICDGSIKTAGHPSGFADPVVVIDCDSCDGEKYYATYIHSHEDMVVSVGDLVKVGDQVAWSGEQASSGFEHLHLEIRKGTSCQRGCRNALRYVPYDDTRDNVKVASFTGELTGSSLNIDIRLELQGYEADFDYLTVELMDEKSTVLTTQSVMYYSTDEFVGEFIEGCGGPADVLDTFQYPKYKLTIDADQNQGIDADESAGYEFKFRDVIVENIGENVKAVLTTYDLRGNTGKTEILLKGTMDISDDTKYTDGDNTDKEGESPSLMGLEIWHIAIIVAGSLILLFAGVFFVKNGKKKNSTKTKRKAKSKRKR